MSLLMKNRTNEAGYSSAFRKSVCWAVLIVMALAMIMPTAHAAMPPAGTAITSSATATYTNAAGEQQTIVSNAVTTTVSEVYALKLNDGGGKQVNPGRTATFSHSLTNTGNIKEKFKITAAEVGAGIDASSIVLYPDSNRDGMPDPGSLPIDLSTQKRSGHIVELAQGNSFHFVVQATTLGSAAEGQATLKLRASTTTPATAVTFDSTNTVHIKNGAGFDVRPGVAIQVTPDAAANVEMMVANNSSTDGYVYFHQAIGNDSDTDKLTFVLNSLKVNGNAVADGDQIGGKPVKLDQSAGYLKIAFWLVAGQNAKLNYQVQVAADAQRGSVKRLVADYAVAKVTDGKPALEPQGVTFKASPFLITVAHNQVVIIRGSDIAGGALSGTKVKFLNTVKNAGSATDTFDISLSDLKFPEGTRFRILAADGVTELPDTNRNGIPDTGAVEPGQTAAVYVEAALPVVSSSSSEKYSVTVTATSGEHSAGAVSTLIGGIKVGAVVLSYNSVDDAKREFNVPVQADKPTAIKLHVSNNNPGNHAESYRLEATVKDNHPVVVRYFKPVGNECPVDGLTAQIGRTDVVNGGQSTLVCARVAALGTLTKISVDFKATGSVTGANSTVKGTFDGTTQGIAIGFSGAKTVRPGGDVVYSHLLRNLGNTEIAANTLTMSLVNEKRDWKAKVYLDPHDTGKIDGLKELTGPIDIAVPANADLPFLVLVSAPTSAADRSVNVTTVTVQTSSGDLKASGTDTTTVSTDDISVSKTQSASSTCSSTVPADATFSTASVKQRPGQCVWYRVTVKNQGTAAVSDLAVADTVPSLTTIDESTISSSNGVTKLEHGVVKLTLDALNANQQVMVTYRVKINQ